MFFILRMLFWIAVVALLLPVSPGQHGQSASTGTGGPSLTERAVGAALTYCTSDPGRCAAGLDGARRIGDLLTGKNGEQQTASQPSPSLQRMVALPPPRPVIP